MSIMLQRQLPYMPVEDSLAGIWRVIARPYGRQAVDITWVRGVPTKIGDFSFTDPYGPKAMSLEFPGLTIFDEFGAGDLHWLAPEVDVDVVWDGPLPDGFQIAPAVAGDMREPKWAFEGYIEPFTRSSTGGQSIQLKGAMRQLDNWLAKPEYPSRPLPYEWAIQRRFVGKPSLRLQPLRIVWPDDWPLQFEPPLGVPSYLMPAGVSEGENWTGLVTRSTGTWDPELGSYINSLLTSMYDETGRWTMDLDVGRQPVMFHRPFAKSLDETVVVIDLVETGKEAELTEDWSQSVTTVYGQGRSLSGVAFSGMSVSPDGSQTTYRPLAYQRQVYPEQQDNGWLRSEKMAREVYLQMQPGLSRDDAAIVGRAHLNRFGHPGVTGTVTLKSDPLVNGVRVPRQLIRAGMPIFIPGALGIRPGLMAHITESSVSIADDAVTLTVDSKFRDQLTAEEVRLRGRDALSVSRMLVAGQYQPPVSDQMLPWSYEGGSGIIPSNTLYNATSLFLSMPSQAIFPWEDWTRTHPPKDPRWRDSYLRLGPASNNADDNWIVQKTETGTAYGVPITMSQAGQIRLTQIAAYDADGNVLRVPFHASFYYVGGVNVMSMPRIPAEQAALFPPYATGQHYPFVRDGWEAYKIDGTKTDPNIPQPTQSVGLVRAYGTFYERAGHWPGSYAEGDAATGLLVDETVWSFDTTNTADAYWDPYRAERNLTNPKAGKLYVMIYCDAQQAQEVFFLGRLFRAEPGSGGS